MHKLYFIGCFCVIISISTTNGFPSSSIQIDSANGKTQSKKVPKETASSKPVFSKKSEIDVAKSSSELNAENFSKVGKLIMNSLQSLADDRSAGTFLTFTKQAIISKLLQILQIIFYATGSAFFICSIIDCKNTLGGGGFGGGGVSSIFHRSDFDTYNHKGRPIIRQIKNAQQLYQ